MPPLAPLLLLVALRWAPQEGLARPIVSVEVRPDTVAVGQPFTVRLRVRAVPGATIRFPAVPDSAGGIEAVDPRAIEDHSTSALLDRTAVYRLVAWEPGRRAVPLGDLRWEQSRGAELLGTGGVQVFVTSVLPADTAQRVPRDARAPFDPPRAWWRWALGALAVLAILWLSARALRRRRATTRPLDAFVDAEAAFAAIDELALDEAGEPGHAVLAYGEVMREYLTRRFPAATIGLTTTEYVRALADNALPILPEEVQRVLEQADAVKFAGVAVSVDGVRAVARAARGVVRDVQTAYEVRLAAADKVPSHRRRGRK